MPHPAPPASPTEPALTVVGIGASAGGLDACQKLVAAIPRGAAVAWIVVQHLDPSHETLMADLLSTHTSLPVMLAIDGALLMPGQIHVIPAGRYLAVQGGRLVVSAPTERHGARLPFDYLLHAMARDCGVRAVCVVLSGSGADGSLGLAAVKAAGGRVYVQDPV